MLFSVAECFTDTSMTSTHPLLSSVMSCAIEATNVEDSVIAIGYPVTKRFVGGMTAEVLICQHSNGPGVGAGRPEWENMGKHC